MGKKQNIGIWIGVLGGGALFFLLYGYLTDLMRWIFDIIPVYSKWKATAF